MKVVLDTNVIISGTILDHGPSYKTLEAWRRNRFLLIISDQLIAEVRKKLEEPRIKETYHLNRRDIQRVLTALRKHGRLAPGKLELHVVEEDPDDDRVIIAAVEGGADFIISGDRHLRNLGEYRGIRVLSPAQFAELLRAEPR